MVGWRGSIPSKEQFVQRPRGVHRTGYVIWGAQHKMKMQGPSIKHDYTFQDSASRALNQMWALLCAGCCVNALVACPRSACWPANFLSHLCVVGGACLSLAPHWSDKVVPCVQCHTAFSNSQSCFPRRAGQSLSKCVLPNPALRSGTLA